MPELRSQERLDEVLVGAIPHMEREARKDVLGAWTRLAGYAVPDPPQRHDLAWGSLRALVRVER